MPRLILGGAIECALHKLLTKLTTQLRGLVEIVEGWRGSRWLMLTGTARQLITDGYAR